MIEKKTKTILDVFKTLNIFYAKVGIIKQSTFLILIERLYLLECSKQNMFSA